MPTKTQKKYVPGSLGKYFAMFVKRCNVSMT